MPKNTQMTRDGRRCAHGHDWRVSFDGRFYYCFYCPAEWFMPDGSAPPQESYKQYPNYTDWSTRTEQGDSNTMPTQEFEAFLDDDDAQSQGEESWIKVRDMLYEPIRVTRANINTVDDTYNPGKTKELAYVHFHFLDDLSETPFVFSSSAKAIMNTVRRAVAGEEFPFDAGIVEILSAEPFNGYFPLRFTSLAKLEAAKAALEDSNTLVNPTTPSIPPETKPAPAPAASGRLRATAASTARNSSVAHGSSANRRSPLAGRGN